MGSAVNLFFLVFLLNYRNNQQKNPKKALRIAESTQMKTEKDFVRRHGVCCGLYHLKPIASSFLDLKEMLGFPAFLTL